MTPRTLAIVIALAVSIMAPSAAGHSGKPLPPAPSSGTSMTIEWQKIFRPNSSQDPCCMHTDNFVSWKVTGQIAAGDTYAFTPQWPISWASELPAATAHLTWVGDTTLAMRTVVPQNSLVSGADPAVDHVGRTITAPTYANSAALCLFMAGGPAIPTWNFTVTITNTGTRTASGIAFTGQESNGYTANYARFCNRADGDADGWNDTLEQGMFDLSYPGASDPSARLGVLGSDYLAAVPRTGATNDEVDAYPPDVNDDGTVDPADVAVVEAWLGQGTGVPFDRVDYTGLGANTYSMQAGLWRRYDLDGDGLVTSTDVSWVRAEVGRAVPDPLDVIAPRVVIDRSYVPASVPRATSVWLGASARDNRTLASVRFSVNGNPVTTQCTTPSSEASDPTFYGSPTAGPEYGCVWRGSKQAGKYTIVATATDTAGHTSSDAKVITVMR